LRATAGKAGTQVSKPGALASKTGAPASMSAATPGARATAATAPGEGRASLVTPGVRVASEWTWRLGVIALGIYALSLLFREFSNIFVPLVISLLIAALLHPLVDWLGRVIPRGLAALVALLGTLAFVVGLLTLVGQQATSGFPQLRDQAAAGLDEVRTWLRTGPLNIDASTLAGYVNSAEDAASANQSTIVSGALGAASTATHLAEGFFIALFATFFFLSSGHRIWAWLLRMFPRRGQEPLDDAARSGWVTLSHYVRATVLVAFIDGVGIGVGAALLGVPLALPLGVLVFFGAFIPIVGALITGALAVLVALVANGLVTALLVLGVVLLVQQVESHVLQPFLLGKAVNVHPLAVILAIATGAALAGIVGALFAVPAVAVANTMITSLANRGRGDPGKQIAEEDAPLAPDEPPRTDVDEMPDPQRSMTGRPTGDP
jgi:predicted PurR-regulated permease PerM